MVARHEGVTVSAMGKRAFMFPGQGSQYVGMGKDLADALPEARRLFERADEVLGIPLSRICFEGPEDELRQTKNTQPAIFLHSLAVVAALTDRRADMAAGHSLGEYSALVFAGALSFEAGLKLVRLRGELMHQAGIEQPGTMAAVIGLDGEAVSDICAAASSAGVVQPANFNSPGQVVISGSVSGVRAAMEVARQKGARMVKELSVSGAFHSPLMAPARAGLEQALASAEIHDARIPVYANATAEPVQDAGAIRRLLLEQLTMPVRWEQSVARMAADGATEFVELGPGKVLQGLVKRIAAGVSTRSLDTYKDLSGS